MKQTRDTGKTGYRTFTLEIPAHVWNVAEAEAIKNRRAVGPQIVLMLERLLSRRKAVAQ